MVKLTNKEHFAGIGLKFCDYRGKECFTDINIKVEQSSFSAHRMILAASSDYFSAMFCGNFVERTQDSCSLNNLTPSSFEEVLSYIYTGVLHIECNTVLDLLSTSDFLGIGAIKDYCEKFMEVNCTVENCVDYYFLAEKYTLVDLSNYAKNFILINFDQVFSQKPIYVFSVEQLCEFLCDDKLQCKSEKKVIEYIVDYLSHYDKLSVSEFRRVMDTLRYGLLQLSDLLSLDKFDLFSRTGLKENIVQVLNNYSKNIYQQPFLCTPFFKPRNIAQLYIIGGFAHQDAYDSFTIMNIYEKNLVEDRSKLRIHRHLPNPVYGCAAVIINNFIFIFGGKCTKKEFTSLCHRYDISNNTWLVLNEMPGNRFKPTAAVFGQNIIVIGGDSVDHTNRLCTEKTVLCYDIAKNEWISAKNDFPKPIASAALCTADKAIYLIGGSGNNTIYSAVYNYNQHKDEWVEIGQLSYPRTAHAMSHLKNNLYIVGGLSSTATFLTTSGVIVKDNLLCFNIATCQCSNLKSMPFKLYSLSCAVFNEKIYVCGGYGYSDAPYVKSTDLIHVYDIKSDMWSVETGCKLPHPVNNSACIVTDHRSYV